MAGLVASLAAACSSGLSVEDRIAAIADARAEVAAPASEVGTAVATVRVRLEGFAAHPSPPEHAALVAANADLEDALTGLDDLDGLGVDAEVPDVIAAADAIAAARAAAADVVDAVADVIDVGAVLVDSEPPLEELVAAWDDAGSRSQLIAHFDELTDEATALVDEITTAVGTVPPGACPSPLDERVQMAVVAAEVSAELGDLVAAYQGTRFDERRAELRADPFGLGSPDIARPLGDDCPMIARAVDATTGVDAALDALETALNPTDLAG